MNRNLTNFLRYILDMLLPPVLRDNKYFMYPLFWIWYKGKAVRRRMEFKSYFHTLSPEEYDELYAINSSLSDDRPTDLNKQSINHIIEAIGTEKDVKLLDMGCGRGYFLNLLIKKGYTNLHACDLFDSFELENVTYTKGNIENLPFEDNAFDVVTCSHTIEHFLNAPKAIAELKRITKKRLIITVPKQRYYHYTFDLHIHFFPEKSYLIDLIKMKDYSCDNKGGDWVFVGKI